MDIHVADHQSLPDGWKRDASLSFTVEGAAKSDDEDEATIKARSVCRGSMSIYENTFNARRPRIGISDFISIADMNDPNKGLVSRDDTMVITAEVLVRNVLIGVRCAEAAADGNLEVLKWLRSKGAAWDTKTCAAAAAGEHLDILKWLRDWGCPWDATTCQNAADGGHLEVLQWARENGCQWGAWACPWKAGPGHIKVLEYYVEEQKRIPEAIPGIPPEVVIKHVLMCDNLTQKDLARLRAVSPSMRAAVAATRRKVEQPRT
jgi:hypothetical protein|tara:strand:+ start:1568 stop:2353 length:786 start_codon:yes stop_codon:yes gene_type:complete|mmetsp:Transcript_2417/g.8367  ORF Transcript_2417/g.8367 Transcript_2417/m.8367 type:complete len:262 (+) Transcript_2417:218-1003(+)